MTGLELTSAANPRVKAVVRLRDRRERERSGLTIVDGAREVRRALDAGVEVVDAYMSETMLAGADARAVLDALLARRIPLHATTPAVFARLAFGERAEGLVAIVRTPPLDLDRLRLPDAPLVVVAEGVEKPGNLGAMLRSADGAGADAFITASPRTDLFNPNTIRASAGTAFSIPLAAAPSAAVIPWLLDHRLRIVAARVEAGILYTEVDLRGAVALVLGSEADGLTQDWSGADVVAVRVPMLGVGDSLNVSVTAAVLLYEARRQRGPVTEPG